MNIITAQEISGALRKPGSTRIDIFVDYSDKEIKDFFRDLLN